jgi:hypothetical protein
MAGNFIFIVSEGQEFQTDKYITISLVDKNAFSYPEMPLSRYRILPRVHMHF